jgi:hypothetical protein
MEVYMQDHTFASTVLERVQSRNEDVQAAKRGLFSSHYLITEPQC